MSDQLPSSQPPSPSKGPWYFSEGDEEPMDFVTKSAGSGTSGPAVPPADNPVQAAVHAPSAEVRPQREAARRNPYITGPFKATVDALRNDRLPARKIASSRHPLSRPSQKALGKRKATEAEDVATRKKTRLDDHFAAIAATSPRPIPLPPVRKNASIASTSSAAAQPTDEDAIYILNDSDGGYEFEDTDGAEHTGDQTDKDEDEEEADGEEADDEEEVPDDGLELSGEQLDELSKRDYSKHDRRVRSITNRTGDIAATFTPHVKVTEHNWVHGFLCDACCVEGKKVFIKKGSVSTMRTHYKRGGEKHYEFYLKRCKAANVTPHPRATPPSLNAASTQSTLDGFVSSDTPILAYSKEGLLLHIVQHVVEDDQPFSVVENDSFRKIVRYCRPSVLDADIPRRTTVTDEVYAQSIRVKEALKARFQNVDGQIHFTFDAGTSRATDPYFTVTASFIESASNDDSDWNLITSTLAFRKIEGAHDGQTFGDMLFEIAEEYDLVFKLGCGTSDNHGVNDKAMRVLGRKLNIARRERDGYDAVDWDPVGKRVRCMEHALHLAAHHFVTAVNRKMIEELEGDDLDAIEVEIAEEMSVDEGHEEEKDDDDDEIDLVPGDDLGKILVFIKLVRKSPQARAFWKLQCEREGVRYTKMKTWVCTRWGSLYDLLQDILERRVVYENFCALADRSPSVPRLQGKKKYADFALEDSSWTRLELIVTVLREPSRAAQSFSSGGCRSLFRATSALEMLQDKWERLLKMAAFEPVHSAIKVGLRNVRKWYQHMDDTDVYVIAMALNPIIKMEFIRVSWHHEYVDIAESTLESVFDAYQAKIAPLQPAPTTSATSNTPAAIIDNGYGMAYMLAHVQSRVSAQRSTANPRQELDDYLRAPLQPESTDAIKWWGKHQEQYPVLSQIARDYLAIPASSTDSERVFSSAGLIGTDRCNRLHHENFEALQTLRSAYRNGFISAEQEIRSRLYSH